MTRTEKISLGAVVALHATVFAWLPMSLAAKRDAVPQAPAIMVTLVQSALNVVNTAPPPPASEKQTITPPKPLVDKPLRASTLKEQPAPTVSRRIASENPGAAGETSAPVTPAASVRAGAEVLAATLVTAPALVKAAAPITAHTPLETARPDHAHNPPPDYPALARRFGITGRVLMRVLVEASGEAREVLIAGSSGHEVLDKAALSSVRNWRFLPARRGADTYAAWVEFPVRFELTQ